MVSIARQPRAGRPPWGALGLLALVVAIEGTAARNAETLASPDAREWALAEHAARTAVRGREILCFGGSMSSHGVLPPVIARVTGRSAYNLSIGFGPPAAQYALLRRALDSGAKPSAVLIDLHPAALSEEPRWAKRLWPEVLGLPEIVRLAWEARDPEVLAVAGLGELFSTYRNRDAIRSAVVAALGGVSNPRPEQNAMIARNKWLNDGGMIQPVKDFRGVVGDLFRPGLLTPPWRPCGASRVYVRRFLDLASAHEVRVFWLIPPFCPAIRGERKALGLDAEFARYASSLQALYPNLTVIDGLGSSYGDDLFCDPVHLNRRGAAAFSEAVARVVAGRLGGESGPRWVALPGYRAADDSALEDLSQSFMAVRSAGVRR